MPEARRSAFLLALIFTAALAAVGSVGTASPAAASDFDITVSGGDSLAIRVGIQRAEVLPDFILERLRRGIPATVGFQVDLWRARAVWFDTHQASAIEEFKLTKDSWLNTYSVTGEGLERVADSLSTVQNILGNRVIELPVTVDQCDSSSIYWVVAKAVVIPLTANDLGEVEDWLVGELGPKSRGILGMPLGIFGLVRDLSGLGDRKLESESRRFRLGRVETGRVQVLAASAPSAAEGSG